MCSIVFNGDFACIQIHLRDDDHRSQLTALSHMVECCWYER